MNKKEVVWNIVNCLLAGGLVFFGAIADGTIGERGWLSILGVVGLSVVIKFYDYWKSEEEEYRNHLITFI